MATPADATHPYLADKGVPANGLRTYKGALVIPMRDTSGTLHSLQFVNADGIKRFLTDGRKAGCYFSIGKPGDRICIAEGYATGATIHAATGYAVAVAFDCGNLYAVAEAMRAKYPMATLIVCADDDINTAGNPGVMKASTAAVAVGGLLAVPDFGAKRPEGAKDFNDLAQYCGPKAVERAIVKRGLRTLQDEVIMQHRDPCGCDPVKSQVSIDERCRVRQFGCGPSMPVVDPERTLALDVDRRRQDAFQTLRDGIELSAGLLPGEATPWARFDVGSS